MIRIDGQFTLRELNVEGHLGFRDRQKTLAPGRVTPRTGTRGITRHPESPHPQTKSAPCFTGFEYMKGIGRVDPRGAAIVPSSIRKLRTARLCIYSKGGAVLGNAFSHGGNFLIDENAFPLDENAFSPDENAFSTR